MTPIKLKKGVVNNRSYSWEFRTSLFRVMELNGVSGREGIYKVTMACKVGKRRKLRIGLVEVYKMYPPCTCCTPSLEIRELTYVRQVNG
jgi:hypothetical protein